MKDKEYDIIVVGAGHAGVEAAYIASKLNKKVALVTYSKKDVSFLPCNVSIGGSAKGIVVRELFALGGLMPIAADETQLQTKILNKSKGPSVQSLRAQIDKIKYPEFVLNTIFSIKNIDFIEDEVLTFDIKNNEVKGIFLKKNKYLKGKKFILCTGTFLNSRVIKGTEIIVEGPDGKATNLTISEQFRRKNVELIRLKTGTPPRIAKESIDFNKLEIEPGSEEAIYFTEKELVKKKYENFPAWLGYTNLNTHNIIKKNFDKSYLFSAPDIGQGPRYCPSIEDKVKRFFEKERHQIFFELETKDSDEIYLAGLSSSLPKEVQEQFIRSIKGLENAIFKRYAYAIEYDSLNPIELSQTLEFKKFKNLYSAGQINGTSGYEEAAAQGLIAGINASNAIDNKEPFYLERSEAYIGVMIDDITTKGIDDPYRLLTSRAEYRLLLRSDNAVKRLYEKAYKYNLIDKERYLYLKNKFSNHEKFKNEISKLLILLNQDESLNKILEDNNIKNKIHVLDLIKRPNISIFHLENFLKKLIEKYELEKEDLRTIEIEIKYEGYIKKQEQEIRKYEKYYQLKLPDDFDYKKIQNLAMEAKEKLSKIRPRTIYQASKIQGINFSDLLFIVHYLNNRK
ncbi:MAG: tRNA uridine-5-carboxymethylaminomethyl(34) synthesis enzyme MnmG [Candidatus Hepatoplasma vulgare]|nr:MAG: tRNA uridine-5-carboxymethylaminomethyl(34) synthesis enzyme MnmG [Candidatus Hepatoplasma sp.]